MDEPARPHILTNRNTPLHEEQTKLPKPLVDLPLPEKELSSGEMTSDADHTPPSVPPQYRREEAIVMQQQQPVDNEETNLHYQPQYDQQAVKTLLSWEGLGRSFHHHTKEYYINISLIVLILQVVLFLFSQYVLMLVVLSLLFVVIAMAVVPPHTVHYRISTEGIAIDEYFYLWQELYDFYFKRMNGEDILHIRTKDEHSSDITILAGDIPRDYLRSLLINYLPYRETVPLTFIEGSGDWLARTFPLDKMPSMRK